MNTRGFTIEEENSGKYFYSQYKTEKFKRDEYDNMHPKFRQEMNDLFHKISDSLADYILTVPENSVQLYMDVAMLLGDNGYKRVKQSSFLVNIKWMDVETQKYNCVKVKLKQSEYLSFISMFELTYMGF